MGDVSAYRVFVLTVEPFMGYSLTAKLFTVGVIAFATAATTTHAQAASRPVEAAVPSLVINKVAAEPERGYVFPDTARAMVQAPRDRSLHAGPTRSASAEMTEAQPAPRPIGITHATVIDVERGTRLRDYSVIIEAGRISTVGPSAQVRLPDGYGEVNARGKFIIPGLIDTHVHLMWDRDSLLSPDSTIRWLKSFVPFGVTTVREASARNLDQANMAWRKCGMWRERRFRASTCPDVPIGGTRGWRASLT